MRNYLRWIPFLLALLLIFGLTFQNCGESAQLTVKLQNFINRILHADQGELWWNNYKLMRHLAHTVEYFLLGVGLMIALKNWWKAGSACALVSCSDEILKAILPGREFDIIDMGFDLLGYAMGIFLVTLILERIKRCEERE